ncbi:MAG TPA: ATP-binding protein [Azospirillaceae bacterium]|nr:ATP-binding protein [Azospirillaceae bacterium]
MERLSRISERWRLIPRIALGGAVLLVLASAAVAFMSERAYQASRLNDMRVQASILAASVTAALAFDDAAAAQEYVNALRASPAVAAAAVYRADGALVASYVRSGALPPPDGKALAEEAARDDSVAVSASVVQEGERLGTVFLRTVPEPMARRLGRYSGTALLLVMATLIVAILGAAQTELSRVNTLLERRALDLADANQNLRVQIEEREKAEAALRQSQKMEALGQLTGGVAHDFNNLLQALSGCLGLIRRRAGDLGLDTIFEAGQQAIDRGAKLTQQLMAFARRQALRPAAIDVRDRLLGMSELLARALRADIRLDIDLAPDLWAVEVDPTQFELAILNLAVNARDAMPAAGQLVVEAANVRLEPGNAEAPGLAGEFVRITVRDTGSGMEPDVLARAFEPFFTTKEVGRGSGLGLSQVYGFVRQSGGEARLESASGRGTAVTMLLPRCHKVPEGTAALPPDLAGRDTGRILLVEDDPIVGSVLGATLEDMGYAVLRAASGDEAAQLLAGDAPVDLLLSDIVMPGRLTGVDLAREARRLRPRLPVVLMTGYSEQVAAGQDFQVLSKPYQLSTLVDALRRARETTAP